MHQIEFLCIALHIFYNQSIFIKELKVNLPFQIYSFEFSRFALVHNVPKILLILTLL